MIFFFLVIFIQTTSERALVSWQNSPMRCCFCWLDADQKRQRQTAEKWQYSWRTKNINKCMNRVKYQKGHPGKESFQQNLFALFLPFSLTHVWVCQPPRFYFNCERFRPLIFNYSILQWISEAKTWFGYPQKCFQPPQLVGVILSPPAKDGENPFIMKA